MKGSDYGLISDGAGKAWAYRADGVSMVFSEKGTTHSALYNPAAELTRIVTAVNAHDDLVEALDGVLKDLRAERWDIGDPDPSALEDDIVAALAKAKGGGHDEG